MQRRYKGNEIPTYDEIIAERNKYVDEHPNEIVPANLTTDVQGISVIICSLEEAEKIKNEDGINGINKKINDAIVDFIDNVLDTALVMQDAVKDMSSTIAKDPNKALKDFNNNKYLKGREIEIKEDGSYEDVSTREEKIGEVESKKSQEERLEEGEGQDRSGISDVETMESEKASGSSSEVEDNCVNTSKTLTDEEVDLLVKKSEEIASSNPDVQKLREIKENPPEKEEGNTQKLLVNVDPNTGENRIVGHSDDFLDDDETFEEMCERIKNSDIDFNTSNPITKEEAMEFLSNKDNNLLVQDMLDDEDIDVDPETIQELLSVANRRIAKEEFNVYRELPEKIRKMIDDYTHNMGINPMDKRSRIFKNQVSESLLDDFIANINMDRIKHDFNVELENIFNKASEEIGEDIVGYSQEKIAKYREATEKMEDPEKKEKLTKILDNIQEAYDLNSLKEFSKKCKIKHFDLEKPQRYFDRFLSKYKDSPYNIYGIDMARPVLYRNLNTGEDEEFTDKDINAFFIAFCKQTVNMSPENPIEHAYMYYLIYNIVLADINKSEKTKEISEKFMNNIKDIIVNLRSRNSSVL